MIHALFSSRQTRREWISVIMARLVPLWLFVWVGMWAEQDGRRKRQKSALKVTQCVFVFKLMYPCWYVVFNLICFFRSSRKFLHLWFHAPSSLPWVLWGKSPSFTFFYFPLSPILAQMFKNTIWNAINLKPTFKTFRYFSCITLQVNCLCIFISLNKKSKFLLKCNGALK